MSKPQLPKFWIDDETENIKLDYVSVPTIPSLNGDIDKAKHFDYWLSQVIAHAEQRTEERIIKLLEGEQCPPDEDLVECWCGSYIQAIALIKGENK